MEKKVEGIYDGFKELGTGKMLVLGLQHVFAMFGATVLVPLLTGLSVSVTLFCAGLATIWFFIITKQKVPIFLGSSFAFLGAFASVANGDATCSRMQRLVSCLRVSSMLCSQSSLAYLAQRKS